MILLFPLFLAQAELTQLHVGQSPLEVQAILERQGAVVHRLESTDPQALRRALIDGHLLAEWNRQGLGPKTKEGGLDPRGFERLLIAEAPGRRWIATFSRGGLTSVLGRFRVPVDASADPPGGWSPRRLDPLRRALNALQPFGLAPRDPDAYGNVTAWRARAGGGAVRVTYTPTEDELLVLLAEG